MIVRCKCKRADLRITLQPMILAILVYHLSMLALVIVTRNNVNIQIGLLCYSCVLVYCIQYLNAFAHENWRTLGFTQDYFDKHGVFASFVVSVPQLLIASVQLVCSASNQLSLLRIINTCCHAVSRTLPVLHIADQSQACRVAPSSYRSSACGSE